MTRWVAAVFGALVFAASHLAIAEPPPEQREADKLFQEGKALLEQGAVDDACSKFAQSLELMRRGGTVLNLAVCREKQGRHATAFRLYQDALAFAISDGHDDRVTIARQAIEDLRSKLSWLTIKLAPGADVPGLVITRDGEVLASSDWSTVAPVDPGPHVVTATAPERERFEATVPIGETGDRQVIEIPVLTPIPIPKPPLSPGLLPTKPAPPPPRAPDWKKPAGITSLGVGLAGIVVGGAFGVKALFDNAELKRICPERQCRTYSAWKSGDPLYQSALTEARVSDVAIPLGVVAAGVGLSLVILARPNSVPRPRTSGSAAQARRGTAPNMAIGPTVGRGLVGATVGGTW